jgi:uncharacterized protein YtpQ (UPF0354 family)
MREGIREACSVNTRKLFEDELQRRGIRFSVDSESDRYHLDIAGWDALISVENLHRDLTKDGDIQRVPRFVDAVLASLQKSEMQVSADRLYWCLEQHASAAPADFTVPLSDRVDRVLVHLSEDDRLITFVTADMQAKLGLSKEDAADRAFQNLARALTAAKVESQEIDGVVLAYFATSLAFKASLMLASNLRESLEPAVGWPLLAVAPDRDFLYLWGARHRDFVPRVGGVVVREFAKASYPLSTEVYEISDRGIRAIGEFPTDK